MKKLTLAALAATAFAAPAQAGGHLDVIAFTINEGCDFATVVAITNDFNTWGAQYGYQARILMPIQSNDLETHFWVGESANAAAYGAAWDAWRTGLWQQGSGPQALGARFDQCTTNVRRAGYDIYP